MSDIIKIDGKFYRRICVENFDRFHPCKECDLLKNSKSEVSYCVIENIKCKYGHIFIEESKVPCTLLKII